MNYDEYMELQKARTYTVAKSNTLIQKSRYDLSLSEQKLLAYVCSLIKPPCEKGKPEVVSNKMEYEIRISDFLKVANLTDGGEVYKDIKASLKNIADKSVWVDNGLGGEILVRWFSSVVASEKEGTLTVKLDETIAPYLLDLQSKYVSYEFLTILNMKSRYSIRLYELFKSVYDSRNAHSERHTSAESYPREVKWTIDLDRLKKVLMVDNIKSYEVFKDFRKKVLEIAKEEVNKFTDIKVDFVPEKTGRKVTKITFTIIRKNSTENYLSTKLNNDLLGVDYTSLAKNY